MRFKRKIPFALIQNLSLATRIAHPWRSQYSLNACELMFQPFFIVGSGRSGNTLVRRTLEASGKVSIPPESYVLARAARKFLYFNGLPWHLLSALIVNEFESHSGFKHWDLNLDDVRVSAKELKAKKRTFANVIELVYAGYSKKNDGCVKPWGDKTPTNALFLDHICAVFPQALYIHLVRDPRAVFSSFCQSRLMLSSTLKQKNAIINNWLDSHNKIENCKQKFAGARFLTVHYESFVKHPQRELTRICREMNIDFKNNMLNFWEDAVTGDIKSLDHHKNAAQPISDKKISQWKQQLSKLDIKLVESRCASFYDELLERYPLMNLG